MVKDRRGFTLVELAIVLVIIGIILGAILKGQALIQNARAKRLQNDLKGLESMIWTYYDRQGRLSGDCNRDGIIGYGLPAGVTYSLTYFNDNSTNGPTQYCRSTSTGEWDPDRAFSDMRRYRVADFSTPNRDLARHILGGAFVIGYRTVGGQNYNCIGIYDIPTWVAEMLETAIDGSVDHDSGRIQRLDTTSGYPTNKDRRVSVVYYFDKSP